MKVEIIEAAPWFYAWVKTGEDSVEIARGATRELAVKNAIDTLHATATDLHRETQSETENARDLEITEELFEFLQGTVPDECRISADHVPQLTPEQAWTVIWFLGNLYWQPTDRVERCDVCGTLYHTWQGGRYLDYGSAPYSFCDDCVGGEAFEAKAAQKGQDE